MPSAAIKVDNLWKEYIVGGAETPHRSLRESLSGMFSNPLRKLNRLQGKAEKEAYFWALKNINVEVEQGDIVGVIGRNGAGKSTFLKVLSRITAPTRGHIEFRGRLASLLEVGTGFHPELTGRENLFLNGAILGMSRREIASKLDEIVAFAEIDKFLDTPVKRYSSGMYVRLAFSVAAHLDSDILLVDEVLAVGDMAFQAKCLNRLDNVSYEGRTVIFVSHNMGTITRLCKKGIVFGHGEIVFHGPVEDAISVYMNTSASKNREVHTLNFQGSLKNKIHFKNISINNQTLDENILIKPDDSIVVSIEGESETEVKDFDMVAVVFKDGARLITLQDAPQGTPLNRGSFKSTMELPSYFLRPGSYSIGIGGQRKGMGEWIWGENLGHFTVIETWDQKCQERNTGIINYPNYGTREQPTIVATQ